MVYLPKSHSPNLKIGLLLYTTAAFRAWPVDASTIQDTLRDISWNSKYSNFPYTLPTKRVFPKYSSSYETLIDTSKVPYATVRYRNVLSYKIKCINVTSYVYRTRVPYGTIPIRYSTVPYGLVPSRTAPNGTVRYRYRHWYITTRYDTVQYVNLIYDTVQYRHVRYGTVSH